MKRRRAVRPFCPGCGADKRDGPTESCADKRGCELWRNPPPNPPEADPTREHARRRLWGERYDAFDALVRAQWEPAVCFGSKYSDPFYGSDYVGALAAAPSEIAEDGASFVYLFHLHDEDLPVERQDNTVSQEDIAKVWQTMTVNSPAQARAIVRALACAFGSAALEGVDPEAERARCVRLVTSRKPPSEC